MKGKSFDEKETYFEAIKENKSITGAKHSKETIKFWVKNNLVLPAKIKEKIFNRSFSTKGAEKGISTYSVKLFTEKYLKGKANFTSDKENGTIILPIM